MRISDWSSDVCSSDLTVLGNAQVRSDYLNRMQAMFGSLGNNNALGNSITDLGSAIENVANSPEVAAHRFDAVNEAGEMTQYFNDMSTQVQQLRSQADAEIAGALDVINQELEVIAELNAKTANNLHPTLTVGYLHARRAGAVKTIPGTMGRPEFTNAKIGT